MYLDRLLPGPSCYGARTSGRSPGGGDWVFALASVLLGCVLPPLRRRVSRRYCSVDGVLVPQRLPPAYGVTSRKYCKSGQYSFEQSPHGDGQVNFTPLESLHLIQHGVSSLDMASGGPLWPEKVFIVDAPTKAPSMKTAAAKTKARSRRSPEIIGSRSRSTPGARSGPPSTPPT